MNQPQKNTATVAVPGPTPWGANYVDVENMAWEPAGLPGAERKVLFADPERGISTVLFRLPPGGVIPFHEHPELEQTYLLEGRLVDHLGECTAGNFVWRAAGSRHAAHCPDGATFIVFFMKPPIMLPAPA